MFAIVKEKGEMNDQEMGTDLQSQARVCHWVSVLYMNLVMVMSAVSSGFTRVAVSVTVASMHCIIGQCDCCETAGSFGKITEMQARIKSHPTD